MAKHRVTWRWFAVSLLVTSALAIPASLWLVPPIQRSVRLRQLTDADPRVRNAALLYVARRASQDPAVAQGAMARLDVPDQQNFLQIVAVLSKVGLWRRDRVPAEAWVRWIGIYAADEHPAARAVAAQKLGESLELVNQPSLLSMLNTLATDTDPNVRYNALVAAAMLSASPEAKKIGASDKLWAIVTGFAKDESPEVARQAYLFIGAERHATPLPDLHSSAATQPAAWTATRQARLWALAMTSPDKPETLREITAVLLAPESAPAERAMAGYCLHALPADHAVDVTVRLFALAELSGNREPLRRTLWRAMLSVTDGRKLSADAREKIAVCARKYQMWYAAPTTPVLTTLPSTVPSVGQPDLMVATRLAFLLPRAAIWSATRPAKPATQPLPATAPQDNGADGWSPDDDPWQTLAMLEFLPARTLPLRVPHGAPDLLRLTAVDTTASPRADDLYDALESDETAFRDLACLVAAHRLGAEDHATLTRKLILNYNDDAKMAGAILSGLTGAETDLLQRRLEAEDMWRVQQVMKLGLWMQAKMPDMENAAPNLLMRKEVPRSTVLLALLHMKHPAALDYILNPRGEPMMDVVALIDQRRWWRAVKTYLPDDAPPYWVWADPDLNAFQLDALRNWYAINRSRLYPGR